MSAEAAHWYALCGMLSATASAGQRCSDRLGGGAQKTKDTCKQADKAYIEHDFPPGIQ